MTKAEKSRRQQSVIIPYRRSSEQADAIWSPLEKGQVFGAASTYPAHHSIQRRQRKSLCSVSARQRRTA